MKLILFVKLIKLNKNNLAQMNKLIIKPMMLVKTI